MVTTNALNITAAGIVKYDGAGSFTADTVTQHDVIVGGAANALVSVSPSTAGFVLTSNGVSADPSFAAPAVGVMPWVVVAGTTQAMAVNTGYTSNNAGLCTLTMPATAAVGDTLVVTGLGAGGWLIAQNASQLVHVGSSVTTTGTGGSIASTNAFDAITFTCVVANTTWITRSEVGNLTIA
jgi:hypothetical protein